MAEIILALYGLLLFIYVVALGAVLVLCVIAVYKARPDKPTDSGGGV